MVLTASPPQDVSIVLRAAVWPGDVTPESAALACSPRRGAGGAASYVANANWLDVSYVIEGAFVRLAGGRIAQLEALATEPQAAVARALLAIWLKKAAECAAGCARESYDS